MVKVNQETRCLIFWPITRFAWKKYKSFVNDIPGINDIVFIEYRPKLEGQKHWENFVHGLYQSHCVSDKVDTPDGLRQKIDKKLKSESLGGLSKEDRTVMAAFYSLEKNCHHKIVDYVKEKCKHDDSRIKTNIDNKKNLGNCYYQNAIKDILRNSFKEDPALPEHPRGKHYGRKRIAHAPESKQGCLDILNFLINNSEVVDEN